MGAALDLLIGEQGKEALDLVDPRRGCRREVHMPAEPFGEPVADQFGLMARGIVHDDVNVEIGGHMLFDGVEEAAEFLRPVARHAFADDGSGLYVEGGKQRGRPVPLVVMGVPFGLPGSHREQRLGAIQRLDLRFLIDAEHQRVVRRVEIEADNVAHPGSGPGQALVKRVLQWVAAAGIVSNVVVTTSAIFSSPILRGAPGRGSSARPSNRLAANRWRQVATVRRLTPSCAAIARLVVPSAAKSTISARIASAREIFRRRVRASSSRRSASSNSMRTADFQAIPTSLTGADAEGST